MKHVMFDLETMGTSSNAPIVSIGAVEFSPEEGVVDGSRKFYANVDLDSSLKAGGVLDGGTIRWWMQQDDEARKALYAGVIQLKDALFRFNTFLQDICKDDKANLQVWCRGLNFDFVILENALRAVGYTPVWRYDAGRDTRTYFDAMRYLRQPPPKGAHNAIHDAEWEAMEVHRAWQFIHAAKVVL